ncbi:phage tail protein [Agarivorans sp. Z349TD_8]|uniref:phage tail protein n=1 Tax=Agarivorans sp. Z349TD_8 TaxID=3421434 RepID=UPI003D7D90D8
MSDPFLGEIAMFGFNFAPVKWANCDGNIMPINSNEALFSLLGIQFGGNGQTTYALPDFRGRVPIGVGDGYVQGRQGGSENVTLTEATMPSHTHAVQATTEAASNKPYTGAVFAEAHDGKTGPVIDFYSTSASWNHALNSMSVSPFGEGRAHNNMQPSQVLNFCIALEGIYPSRN